MTSKIYTKTGDEGKTSLVGGARVSKAELRLEAYGTVDELNSALGLAAALMRKQDPRYYELAKWCASVQMRLFDLGSHLACADPALRATLPTISAEHLDELEKQMDEMTAKLVPLRNFILPGGDSSAAAAHLARTVCRRAERLCVRLSIETDIAPILGQYLNRASDWCFVFARYLNWLAGEPEIIWKA